MKRSVMAACTIALGFGGVMVAAPQASAGTNSQYIRTVDAAHGGSIQFFHAGDKATICDLVADGKSVWGRFYTTSGDRLGTALTVGGKGNCVTVSEDIPEGRRIQVDIWLKGPDGLIWNTWNYTFATT
ncbi:hypothetical protein [Yinghuangia soli]|uniref:Uncharacterized protein n=1 Tax=Yinghuangia soli TaxID=2908204 RepID=A0AA41U4D5_9ACTN|nr:hypothetical protein [Yinghuangia soli]MCF2532785.1 hypothetical protein [Yinghuangia soli]